VPPPRFPGLQTSVTTVRGVGPSGTYSFEKCPPPPIRSQSPFLGSFLVFGGLVDSSFPGSGLFSCRRILLMTTFPLPRSFCCRPWSWDIHCFIQPSSRFGNFFLLVFPVPFSRCLYLTFVQFPKNPEITMTPEARVPPSRDPLLGCFFAPSQRAGLVTVCRWRWGIVQPLAAVFGPFWIFVQSLCYLRTRALSSPKRQPT